MKTIHINNKVVAALLIGYGVLAFIVGRMWDR